MFSHSNFLRFWIVGLIILILMQLKANTHKLAMPQAKVFMSCSASATAVPGGKIPAVSGLSFEKNRALFSDN